MKANMTLEDFKEVLRKYKWQIRSGFGYLTIFFAYSTVILMIDFTNPEITAMYYMTLITWLTLAMTAILAVYDLISKKRILAYLSRLFFYVLIPFFAVLIAISYDPSSKAADDPYMTQIKSMATTLSSQA